jgi:hypothetical protein
MRRFPLFLGRNRDCADEERTGQPPVSPRQPNLDGVIPATSPLGLEAASVLTCGPVRRAKQAAPTVASGARWRRRPRAHMSAVCCIGPAAQACRVDETMDPPPHGRHRLEAVHLFEARQVACSDFHPPRLTAGLPPPGSTWASAAHYARSRPARAGAPPRGGVDGLAACASSRPQNLGHQVIAGDKGRVARRVRLVDARRQAADRRVVVGVQEEGDAAPPRRRRHHAVKAGRARTSGRSTKGGRGAEGEARDGEGAGPLTSTSSGRSSPPPSCPQS